MLGKRIAQLRKMKGLTQEALSDAIHITPSAISQWETGRTKPAVQQMYILAKFFGITVSELESGCLNEIVRHAAAPEEEKIDLPTEQEIDDAIAASSAGLTPDEVQRVVDFIAGLKAARRP